jgi:hypothetical protein
MEVTAVYPTKVLQMGNKKGLHMDATQGNEGVASNHPHILWRSVAERGIISAQLFTIFVSLLDLISSAYVGFRLCEGGGD